MEIPILRKFTGKKRAVEIYKFTGNIPFIDSADGILYGNLKEKKHMEMSQEPFFVKLTGKMLHATPPTSIEHRVLTVTVRNPLCV